MENQYNDNWDELRPKFVEIELAKRDDFLKIKETLTRIGISSINNETGERRLYQSCHILHKRGKYFLVHFKELFLLDGKQSTLNQSDIERRNTIAYLINDWGLAKVLNPEIIENKIPVSKLAIIPFRDKGNWILEEKYTIGKK